MPSDETANRIRMSVEADRFALTLPEGFTALEKQASDAAETGAIGLVQYHASHQRGVCTLCITDYTVAGDLLESYALLETVQEGLLENIKHTLELQEDFRFLGYPARSLWYTEDDNGVLYCNRVMLVFVKPLMYQLYFTSHNRAELEAEDVEAFFDAFEITA